MVQVYSNLHLAGVFIIDARPDEIADQPLPSLRCTFPKTSRTTKCPPSIIPTLFLQPLHGSCSHFVCIHCQKLKKYSRLTFD